MKSKLNKKVLKNLNTKSNNIDKLTASGIAFDMGAIYKVGLFHDMTIGFSIKNFGGDMKYSGENLQQQIKLSDNIFEEEDVRIEVTSESYSLPISFDLGSSLTPSGNGISIESFITVNCISCLSSASLKVCCIFVTKKFPL